MAARRLPAIAHRRRAPGLTDEAGLSHLIGQDKNVQASASVPKCRNERAPTEADALKVALRRTPLA